MSPEEVLAFLKRLGRFEKSVASWTNATTVAQAFGNLGRVPGAGAWDLCDGLNEFFGTEISEKDFGAAVCPAKSKTLGDLCQLIAAHAVVPRIEPFTPQTALEVVFAILLSADADISAELSTAGASSSLAPYLRKHRHRKVFTSQIVKLGCGRVPSPIVEYPKMLNWFGWVVTSVFIPSILVGTVSGILTAVSAIANDTGVAIFLSCLGIGMASILPFILLLLLLYALGYARFRLEGLETFGDLARAIVGHPSV